MCGIAGFIDFAHTGTRDVLDGMADALKHRGPDDRGAWLGSVGAAQVGLGHRRLSIIDLRAEAAQPMRFGDLTIVFNGEIYNYVEIRRELVALGHDFKTSSDTEVLLHAFSEWGPDSVERLIGMFAFVIIDASQRRAYLVRDRVGVKPLYVYREKDVLLFASESKAFFAHPAFDPQLDVEGFSRYFDYGVLPGTMSIFEKAEKIPPGAWMEIDLDTGTAHTNKYWSIEDFYEKDRVDIDYAEALARFEELFRSAARYRMVADVPVGLFLSGGYDSTGVLASLVQEFDTPIQAFTIGFEVGNNELPQASKIARHLGSDHHAYVCTESDARSIIPELPDIYDEPFADSSAIPTVLVSRFAVQHVKVALSADGGDELLYGYTSYAKLGKSMARLSRLPRRSRRVVAAALKATAALVPTSRIQKRHMLEGLAAALHEDDSHMALNVHVLAKRLPKHYARTLFKGFVETREQERLFTGDGFGPIDEAAAWDFGTYLADDILVKVDRATMSASLEGREPFLDHRLAEFLARLPSSHKFDGGKQKRLLRDYVHKHVPASIMEGPKRGFSVPVLRWLREDLSYLLDEHLAPSALKASGMFRVDAVQQIVATFRRNQLHYSPLVWKLLVFQMWHARWMRS